MRFLLIQLIRIYKYFISPLLGNNCRFYPSCSVDALEQHGVIIGLFLIIKRIVKCQPFHEGGIDHVPKKNR